MVMLRAESISLRYGTKTILSDVSMVVQPGEVLAICGPNGAGKSSLLKILSSELPPSSGRVFFDGRSLNDWEPRALARRRAVLPQHSTLAFPFQVLDVVSLGRLPHGRTTGDEEIIFKCLDFVNARHLAERRYPTLSGGEKQRVQLARVLAQLYGTTSDPCLLFLDEPTSALDMEHQNTLFDIVDQLRETMDISVVVVVHDLNIAAARADRILLLSQGEKVLTGAPVEVLTPEMIASTFSVSVHILEHPTTGRPLVVPDYTVRKNGGK